MEQTIILIWEQNEEVLRQKTLKDSHGPFIILRITISDPNSSQIFLSCMAIKVSELSAIMMLSR